MSVANTIPEWGTGPGTRNPEKSKTKKLPRVLPNALNTSNIDCAKYNETKEESINRALVYLYKVKKGEPLENVEEYYTINRTVPHKLTWPKIKELREYIFKVWSLDPGYALIGPEAPNFPIYRPFASKSSEPDSNANIGEPSTTNIGDSSGLGKTVEDAVLEVAGNFVKEVLTPSRDTKFDKIHDAALVVLRKRWPELLRWSPPGGIDPRLYPKPTAPSEITNFAFIATKERNGIPTSERKRAWMMALEHSARVTGTESLINVAEKLELEGVRTEGADVTVIDNDLKRTGLPELADDLGTILKKIYSAKSTYRESGYTPAYLQSYSFMAAVLQSEIKDTNLVTKILRYIMFTNLYSIGGEVSHKEGDTTFFSLYSTISLIPIILRIGDYTFAKIYENKTRDALPFSFYQARIQSLFAADTKLHLDIRLRLFDVLLFSHPLLPIYILSAYMITIGRQVIIGSVDGIFDDKHIASNAPWPPIESLDELQVLLDATDRLYAACPPHILLNSWRRGGYDTCKNDDINFEEVALFVFRKPLVEINSDLEKLEHSGETIYLNYGHCKKASSILDPQETNRFAVLYKTLCDPGVYRRLGIMSNINLNKAVSPFREEAEFGHAGNPGKLSGNNLKYMASQERPGSRTQEWLQLAAKKSSKKGLVPEPTTGGMYKRNSRRKQKKGVQTRKKRA